MREVFVEFRRQNRTIVFVWWTHVTKKYKNSLHILNAPFTSLMTRCFSLNLNDLYCQTHAPHTMMQAREQYLCKYMTFYISGFWCFTNWTWCWNFAIHILTHADMHPVETAGYEWEESWHKMCKSHTWMSRQKSSRKQSLRFLEFFQWLEGRK
jgi:hypothetical protein